jgi:hypothetical protein
MRRFDVLMDDPSAMHLANSGREATGEPQKETEFQRTFRRSVGSTAADGLLLDESLQWLALLVLEDQGRTSLVMRQGDRPQSPRRIELGPQAQFVFQHPHPFERWMRRRRHGYED